MALRVMEQTQPEPHPAHSAHPLSLARDSRIGGARRRPEVVCDRCGAPGRAGTFRRGPACRPRSSPRLTRRITSAIRYHAARTAAARHDHHPDARPRGAVVALCRQHHLAFDLRALRHPDRGQRQHASRDHSPTSSRCSGTRVSRSLRIDEPFNFSRINNLAAARARGSLLCFLNNDTEVISPDWLEEMVSLAVRDGVGAVGAMLYYPNDTDQHAGVILGLGGIASHAHRGQPRGMPGNYGRAALTQTMSAVTAACMVVRKSALRCGRRIRRDAGRRVQRRRSVSAAAGARLPECVDAVRGALSLRIGQPR